MAIITRVVAPVTSAYNRLEGFIATWALMTKTTDDEGEAFEKALWSDRSVQVNGTFGVGGSVSIRGSNDGVNYYVLTDPQGNALDITLAKIEQITEVTRYIKPVVTAGDGTTLLTVTVLAIRKG